MVRLSLPSNGGTLRVLAPPRTLAPCDGYLRVSPFQAVLPPLPTPPSPPPNFSVRLLVPRSAVAGQPLRFGVQLTNLSSAPLEFPPDCPTYDETLRPASASRSPVVSHSYMLNCRGVAAIPLGARVTFDMVFDVPTAMSAGPYTFFWSIFWDQVVSEGTTLQVSRR
jgi:hypothetical protein